MTGESVWEKSRQLNWVFGRLLLLLGDFSGLRVWTGRRCVWLVAIGGGWDVVVVCCFRGGGYDRREESWYG